MLNSKFLHVADTEASHAAGTRRSDVCSRQSHDVRTMIEAGSCKKEDADEGRTPVPSMDVTWKYYVDNGMWLAGCSFPFTVPCPCSAISNLLEGPASSLLPAQPTTSMRPWKAPQRSFPGLLDLLAYLGT